MTRDIQVELPMGNGQCETFTVEADFRVSDHMVECYGWTLLAEGFTPSSLQEQLIDNAIDLYIEQNASDIEQDYLEGQGDWLHDQLKDQEMEQNNAND